MVVVVVADITVMTKAIGNTKSGRGVFAGVLAAGVRVTTTATLRKVTIMTT